MLDRSIRRPIKISEVSPEYTALARASRVTGTVILQTVIDEEGRIESVHVFKGLTGLTAEAIKAVRQWHYTPAQKDGEPVAIFFNLSVNFELR